MTVPVRQDVTGQGAPNLPEIVAALADGRLFGTVGEKPRQIETHCSLIFLIGDRAFKLKKPVTFSYLDYGSVEAREACIKAELDLNRRTAPDLYIAYHKIIRRQDGSLTLAEPDDPAPALDWLLEMKRFPDNVLLTDLAKQERLTPALMRDLQGAALSQLKSNERREEQGRGYVLIRR